ncbi:NUDIX hydrolase [Planomonospora sphaerica]|uniref:NUDIX hydrolase n=1 Tax=Planomonospora sphaerica TaxID=161355 RepID=A0A161LZ42_9ACTN|nr:NUDIX hydrolase [Planomonospora sphaerica]GAT71259.1 NUDIX hydrolase [Planomonospora sphaerica]
MSKPYLDPPEWYATLPTIYTSACMLLTDEHDRVLLVKPNYRPYWAIPGGVVEAGEAPHECVTREITEELGLTVPAGELLVVDWVPPYGQRPRPMMNFLFDGGTLTDPGRIRLQTDELDAAEFFSWEDAATRMPDDTAARIPAARRARKNARTVYLPADSAV